MPLLLDLALSRAVVERAAHRRSDAAWFAQVCADARTAVLVVVDGSVSIADTGVHWRTPADVADVMVDWLLLGMDEDETVYVAAHVRDPLAVESDHAGEGVAAPAWRNLREIGHMLDAREAGLVTTAVALSRWHQTHMHCTRCGEPTEVTAAGWARRCPRDGSEHYPRTEPAVIALPICGDRAALGRRADWPVGRYSTLAGFVEAGESAEHALIREIAEEAALTVLPEGIEYRGSQPWPFPASLMLGYHVHVASMDSTPDGEEIVDVRWFTRDELICAIHGGDVVLPPRVSIARRLIEDWLGHPVSGDSPWR